MKRTVIIFLGALVIMAVHFQSRLADAGKGSTKQVATTQGEGDCGQKKFCVAIYVAPWCGACRSQEHVFKSLVTKAKSNRDYGMKIVVGQGRSSGDNEAMAKEFGSAAVIDADGSFLRKNRVTYFPSILVFDSDRDILLRDQEARDWVAEKFN